MKQILILSTLLFYTFYGFSQTIKLSGTVKDLATKESIPYATIAVYNNETLITGISTDEKGTFLLKIDKPFSLIEISFLGYKKKEILRNEITNYKSLNIFLQPNETELDEVVITAEKTATQLKIDRKVINLGSDLQQSGINILEAFDNISEIQTDLDNGTISLRGSGNIRLLVNGKPSGVNASELLSQIPSSSVEKIEIITSPSVKNQADGLAGIVNIILKKDTNLGLNLDVNASVGTKRYGYGFNGNYNFSKINFRLNASLNDRDMNSTETIFQRFNNGNTRDIFTPYNYNNNVKTVNSGIDIFLKNDNEISFDFNYTDANSSTYNITQFTNITNTDDFEYLRDSKQHRKTLTFNTNYLKKFSGENHFIELDYNINTNENEFPASDFIDNVFQFSENLKNDNTLQALALDYSVPISQTIKFETGASWNSRRIDSERFFAPNSANNTYNNFNYKENVYGLYALNTINFGNLNLQTGLRFEYFKSNSFSTLTDNDVNLKFSNLFPSIHLSYKPNENNTLSGGYSKRVLRPNFRNVNPFQLGNPYFQRVANPELRPEFSDNFDVSYLFSKSKLNVSTSAYYRYSKDIIQRIDRIDEDGVKKASYDNIGSKNAYGIELNIGYKWTKFLNTQISANYYKSNINTDTYVTWSSLYSSSIVLRNTFKINKNISADISYRHTPKRQNSFNFIEPRNRVDLAIRAKFLENRLTTSFRIIDVLDDNLFYRNTVTQDVEQLTIFKFQSQTFGVLFNVNYKLFDNAYKNRKRKKRNYNHGGSRD